VFGYGQRKINQELIYDITDMSELDAYIRNVGGGLLMFEQKGGLRFGDEFPEVVRRHRPERAGNCEDVVENSELCIQLERARLYKYRFDVHCHRKKVGPTMTPAAREPMRCVRSLSMMRTGTPFWRRTSARTRPEGPAPACRRQQSQLEL
jgi:hypothetical protein